MTCTDRRYTFDVIDVKLRHLDIVVLMLTLFICKMSNVTVRIFFIETISFKVNFFTRGSSNISPSHLSSERNLSIYYYPVLPFQ